MLMGVSMAPGAMLLTVIPQRRELDREIPHHHFHAALGHAVGGEIRERQLFVHRADVDDPAAGLASPRWRANACVLKKGPVMFTSITAR